MIRIKKYAKIKDFCNVVMPSEDTDKTPLIIYADLQSLIGKINGYKNNEK